MRILVFMSDNRNITPDMPAADYNSLTAAINYEYCKKHNYDFIYYRPYFKNEHVISIYNCIDVNTKEPRDAAWSKLLSTILALELNYDYVVYIDSDCIFRNFDMTIEDFIAPHTDKLLIFLNNKPWGDDKPCSGFYVCNVCDASKDIIRNWYNMNLPEKNKNRAWEQDALWCMYEGLNISIVDMWMFEEEEGQFLRHITGYNQKHIRMPYFFDIISKFNIDYNKNIQDTHVISFDTYAVISTTP